MQRNYNFIYKKLVEDQYDIVGHIAYSLYKADKIKFIENFKNNNAGKEPEDSDFKPFHDASCLDGNIERCRLTASFILKEFLDNSLEESIKDIEDKCLKDHKNMLAEVVSPLTPITEERRRQILKEFVVEPLKPLSENDHVRILDDNVVKPLKPMNKWTQFFFGVSQSVAGALLFALLLAAIGFINLFKANDITFHINKNDVSAEQAKPNQIPQEKDTTSYMIKPAP